MPRPEAGEAFKGGVHYLAGSLAFAMCAYNTLRYVETHTTRNAVNAGVYAALWGFEWGNMRQHQPAAPDAAYGDVALGVGA